MKVKLLFIFALLLTAVTGVWAADDSGSCGEVSYSYVESTHTLTISGTGAMEDYDDYDERPWSDYTADIESVVIGNGVTSIGINAFKVCYALTSVTIPNSVTKIKDFAFESCSALPSVTIPNSVTTIEGAAFRHCSSLTTVTIGTGVTYIGYDAFYGCTAVTDVDCDADPDALTWEEDGCDDFKSDGSTIIHVENADPWYAKFTGVVNGIFRDPSTVPFSWNYDSDTKTLTISGTEAIPSYSEDDRPWKDYVEVVENIVINDGVGGIGKNAFYGCSALTSVTIPNSVTTIGEVAFRGCSSMATVTIGTGVTYIGRDAFYRCTAVTDVYCNADPDALTWEEADCDDFKENGTTIIHVANAAPWYAKFTGVVNGIFRDPSTIPLTWDYDSDTKTLTFSGTEAIPSYSDSDDRPWFNDFPEAEKIVIEDGVLGIGRNAFYSYKDLTSVTIPNSVTNIGKYAFEDCTSLTSITIPASVTNISTHVFKYCKNLATLTVDSKNPVYDSRNNCNAIIETSSNTLVAGCVGTTIPTGVTSIGDDAFYGCTGLMSISIPASVTSIGYYAFEECSSLTSVTVYSQDCTLGNGAFDGCNILETIYVPSDLVDHYKTAWSDYAGIIVGFVGGDCGATVTWKLGSGVLTICGTGAMADYDDPSGQPWKDYRSSITRVVIEEGVTTIGKKAFAGCTGLTSVTVYALDCTLGNGAFDGCNNLEAIYVPSDKVENYKAAENWSAYASIITEIIISQGYCGAEGHEEDVTWVLKNTSHNYTLTISGTGDMADYIDSDYQPWYSYARNIAKVVINDGVTSIGDYAFSDCSALTSVTIPNSVTSIGDYAFYNCSALPSVTIPNNVTSIGDFAFSDCSALPSVTIPNNVTSIGDFAFQYCPKLSSFTIPSSVTSIGDNPFIGDYKLTTLTVDAGNTAYKCVDGMLLTIGGEELIICLHDKTSVTIPSSVTEIGPYAFDNYRGLTNVTIPSNVIYIGDGAFVHCENLKTVTIGSGVNYIGYDAFYGCTAVTDVYCYADPDALTWDEGGCDDFKDGKATKCHVTDADTWSDKFDGEVNVKFVGDLAPKSETNPAGEEYWSSYYNSAAHLKADANTTVYKASLSGSTVTLTEISDKVITAGQAVLLKKTTTGDVVLTPCADASEDDYSGNDLEGVDEETAKESSSDYYVLSYQNAKLSFYKYSGATLGANKAFFKVPANSSRDFLDIVGDVTGIDVISKMSDGRSDVYYDLNGRRVMNPTKGIYIVNGRKVVIK